jgi:hypothetical protein
VRRAGGYAYCEHDRVRARPPWLGLAGALTGAAGLLLIGLGTFLPWFRSGQVLRDSYQSISIIRTIKVLDGSPLSLALDAWTMIVPVVTLCVAGYAFGLRRTAATVAGIMALICGTIGAIAAVEASSDEASLGIAGTGPTVTLIGGILALLGVIGVLAGRRTRASTVSGGES